MCRAVRCGWRRHLPALLARGTDYVSCTSRQNGAEPSAARRPGERGDPSRPTCLATGLAGVSKQPVLGLRPRRARHKRAKSPQQKHGDAHLVLSTACIPMHCQTPVLMHARRAPISSAGRSLWTRDGYTRGSPLRMPQSTGAHPAPARVPVVPCCAPARAPAPGRAPVPPLRPPPRLRALPQTA
jgi:hypothetical protein